MKRVFLIFIPLIVFVFLLSIAKISLISNDTKKKEVVKSVDLGFIIEKYFDVDNIIYLSNEKVVGECVKIKMNKNQLNKICDRLGVNIGNKYRVDDKFIIEGFSTLFKYKNKYSLTNVQISVENQEITIGTPYIFGSY